MADEPSHTPLGPLTDSQQARLDYAQCDLISVRARDLAQMDAASLILLIERLKTRLDDILSLTAEACDTPPAQSATTDAQPSVN